MFLKTVTFSAVLMACLPNALAAFSYEVGRCESAFLVETSTLSALSSSSPVVWIPSQTPLRVSAKSQGINPSFVAISSDSKVVVTAQVDRGLLRSVISIENVVTKVDRPSVLIQGRITSMAISKGNDRVFAAVSGRGLVSLSLATGQIDYTIPVKGEVTAIATSDSGKYVGITTLRGEFRLLEAATGREYGSTDIVGGGESHIRFLADESQALVSTYDDKTFAIDLSNGQITSSITGSENLSLINFPSGAFTSDGKIYMKAAPKDSLEIKFKEGSGVITEIRRPKPFSILKAEFIPNSRKILAMIGDNHTKDSIAVFDAFKGKPLYAWGGGNVVTTSPDGSLILIGHSSGRLGIYSSTSYEQLAPYFEIPGSIVKILVSPDNRFILVIDKNGKMSMLTR